MRGGEKKREGGGKKGEINTKRLEHTRAESKKSNRTKMKAGSSEKVAKDEAFVF